MSSKPKRSVTSHSKGGGQKPRDAGPPRCCEAGRTLPIAFMTPYLRCPASRMCEGKFPVVLCHPACSHLLQLPQRLTHEFTETYSGHKDAPLSAVLWILTKIYNGIITTNYFHYPKSPHPWALPEQGSSFVPIAWYCPDASHHRSLEMFLFLWY